MKISKTSKLVIGVNSVIIVADWNLNTGDKDDCITHPLGKDCEAKSISDYC